MVPFENKAWLREHDENWRTLQAMKRRQAWMAFVGRLELGWYASWRAVLTEAPPSLWVPPEWLGPPKPPEPEPEPEPPSLLDGLTGYWKLDEAASPRLDSTGNGISFTEVNAPPPTVDPVPGKIGNGANFTFATPSRNHFISTPGPAITTGNIDFSIAVWVKFRSYDIPETSGDWLLAKTGYPEDNNVEYNFYLTSGVPGIWYEWGGGWVTEELAFVDWDSPIPIGEWGFIVAVHDSVNDLLKISVNGGTFITSATNGNYPGVHPDKGMGIGYHVDGIIDELGFWKRALSQADVAKLYNGGTGLAYPFAQ